MKLYKLKNNDEIWFSKDFIDCPIDLGEYYYLNQNGKFEIYKNQPESNHLFLLINYTFQKNINRKWYQFWKPAKIIDGYIFQYVDLEEKYE